MDYSMERATDASEQSAIPVRRENLSRYRRSGVSVYDADVSSLRSLDEHREDTRWGRASRLLAEMKVLQRQGVRHHCNLVEMDSRGPVISVDGASFDLVGSSMAHPPPQLDADIRAHPLCKHKISKPKPSGLLPKTIKLRHAVSAILDGTSAPSPSTGVSAQDHAAIQTPVCAPSTQPTSTSPTSHSAPQTIATAPSGTTFVTNPGGSTFAIAPNEPLVHPTTFNTLSTDVTQPGRA